MKLSGFLALKHATVTERLDKRGGARFVARSVATADSYVEVHAATRLEAMHALAAKLGWRGKSRCPLPEVGKWEWTQTRATPGADHYAHLGDYILYEAHSDGLTSWEVGFRGSPVAHAYSQLDMSRTHAERAARRHWFLTHREAPCS